MKYSITTIRNDYCGFSKLAKLAADTREVFLEEINLDFSGCGFFEANMSATLYSVLTKLQDNLNTVRVVNMPSMIEEILRRNEFLPTIFGILSMEDHKGTTIPFKRFRKDGVEQFSDYLEKNLQDHDIPKMSPILKKHFQQSILEVFQNSCQYASGNKRVFACGQHFPKKNRLNFTLADVGIGISGRVREYFPGREISSTKAIEWALVDGHSTREQCIPGGMGLGIVRKFIRLNKGCLRIVSGTGYYQEGTDEPEAKVMENDFPGTSITIEINTQDDKSYRLGSEPAGSIAN